MHATKLPPLNFAYPSAHREVIYESPDLPGADRSLQALRTGDLRFRSFLDAVGPAMFVGLLAPDGTLLEANQAALEATGLIRREAIGRMLDEVAPWSYSRAVQQQLRASIDRAAQGESSHYEVQILGMDGRLIDLDFSLRPVRGETGGVEFLVPSASVITERKQVQAKLEWLATMPENNPNPILEIDLVRGVVHYMNPAFEQLMPEPGGEGQEHPFLAGLQEVEQTLARGECSVVRREIEACGQFWLQTIVHAPRTRHLRIYAVDITERKLVEQRNRRLARIYAVLSDINQLIVRERERQVILDSVCTIALQKGSFCMAWIAMLDEVEASLKVTSCAGMGDEMRTKMDVLLNAPAGEGGVFITKALQTGRHAICNDFANDPAAACWRLADSGHECRSMTALPLRVGGRVVGTLNLFASTADFFDEEEMGLLDELAADIGFALEVSQGEEERREAEKRHVRQRRALIDLTSQWGTRGDDALLMLRQISETAARTLNVARVSIWRYNGDRSAIRCVDLYEWEEGRHTSGMERQAASHPGYFRAIETMELIVADDANIEASTHEFADDYFRPLGIRSVLDVPILVGGIRTGVMCFEQVRTPREWKTDEKTFALATSNLVTLALEGLERRQAEASLRESEKRFRQFAETIEEVFWMTDPTGAELLYVSPAYEKIWRRTCASLHAAPLSWLETVHPDDRERVAQAMATKRTSGEYDETFRIQRPDGSVRWIRDRAFPVCDSHGRVLRIVGTAGDITEGKNLEGQLLRAQRMESIGTLAGGIAHDLNNVLTPIMMSIDLLKLQERDARKINVLATIEGSAKRGADMVRQVLSFARGVKGQQVEIRVGSLLKEIEKITNETFLKNIQVHCGVPADLWSVQGDPTQLHQVLLNLCVNARDAMPEGGRLTLTAGNVQLDKKYTGRHLNAKPGPYVLIRVDDTGTGMPPEVIERIFDPFFTTKEPGKGTGLGLSTTLTILKSHQGFLHVESQPGVGSRFEVFLPAHLSVTAEKEAAVSSELPRGNGELVLVIDDENDVLQIIRQILETYGYRVMLASSGAEAVAMYSGHMGETAVVLTDMMMPLMDGTATIQALQAMNPAVRIIASGGLAVNGMLSKAMNAGAKRFIPKPYTSETLLGALQAVLHA